VFDVFRSTTRRTTVAMVGTVNQEVNHQG